MTNEIAGKLEEQIQLPEVISYFVKGEDAKAVYDLVRKTVKEGLWFDDKNQLMYGCTPFAAARVGALLRPNGYRALSLKDLSRPEIIALAKGKHYFDSAELVARSADDNRHRRNVTLLEQIIQLVEAKQKKVKFPFKISGFDVSSWEEDTKGYGLKIIPLDDFSVVEDERLSGEYNGEKFSVADELGLPKFDKNGNRTWHARDKGLSRLYLNRDGDVNSNDDNLAGSDDRGRVVVVRDEVGRQKILNEPLANLQAERDRQIAEIQERYARAEAILRGK